MHNLGSRAMDVIFRGQCNKCGWSRNIWVTEMHWRAIPCDHRDLGCTGSFALVYKGSKSGIPAHLRDVACNCLQKKAANLLADEAAGQSTQDDGERGSFVEARLHCPAAASGWVQDLQCLDDAELQQLLASQQLQDDFLIEKAQELQEVKERLGQAHVDNEAEAAALESKARALEEAQHALLPRLLALESRQAEVRAVAARQAAGEARLAPDELANILRRQAAAAEEAGEGLLQAILDSAPQERLSTQALSQFRAQFVVHQSEKHRCLALVGTVVRPCS